MAGTHAVRILNWAVQEGKLTEHHCHKLHRLYDVDRSEIVWTQTDRAAFNAVAPEWVRRILCAACETGLRPADLIKLTPAHVEQTPLGRRLRVRTNKRKRLAHIPITPELAEVIDTTPAGRLLILTNASGNALSPHRASEGVRQWRDKAKLSDDLRLYDARGTAATRLLNAGLSLAEIANHMGWSVRYAANVIEHYPTRSRPASRHIDRIHISDICSHAKSSCEQQSAHTYPPYAPHSRPVSATSSRSSAADCTRP
ncbi:tyrosine-type recombinase/integrase [Rhodovulum sulfidophilum]|uniref:tyrosine-type recombinase/integrase n=1 Tax=Rhodovulum sulfidophilum TaxID=35806 RepID=UPI001EEE8B9E|nr:tyrosine-type recombinase/integrase [Rhodovulum sulfidophilum]